VHRFATSGLGKAEDVTGIVIILVVVGTLVGLGFAFGGPALAALLVLAALIGLGWLLVMGLSRRSPGDVARQADDREFFGPGGPDDPNR
jgi:predicted transporter